jgi:hypothetical protein
MTHQYNQIKIIWYAMAQIHVEYDADNHQDVFWEIH